MYIHIHEHSNLGYSPPPYVQVQLLVSTEDIQNFALIRKSLERLKLLVEEAELWVQEKPTDTVELSAPRKGPKVHVGDVAISPGADTGFCKGGGYRPT